MIVCDGGDCVYIYNTVVERTALFARFFSIAVSKCISLSAGTGSASGASSASKLKEKPKEHK